MDFLVNNIKVEIGFNGVKIYTNDPIKSMGVYQYLISEGFIRKENKFELANN